LDTVLHLFIIVTLGYLLGNVKFRGFSLDISAILVVALIAGYYGVTLPEDFKYFGLALFMYAVGLQTGPLFFETFKKNGIFFNTLATGIICFIFFVIFISGKLLGFSKGALIGVFTGSMSSAPSLAAVLEHNYISQASVFFGLTYPFGIISSVVFVRLIPTIFRINIQNEVTLYENQLVSSYEKLGGKNFLVTNENFGREKITKDQFEVMTGCFIERIEKSQNSKDRNIIEMGDILRVVGTEQELKTAQLMLGQEIKDFVEFHDNMKVLRLLVTSKQVVGKKIGEIKRLKALGGVITKIRRSGIDIKPNPGLTLMLGDKLYITVPENNADAVTEYIGNNLLAYPAGDFLPISIGIVLGIFIGKIPINLPFLGDFRLSFVGGVFITAVVLGRLGRTGKLVWQLSPHSTSLLKTLGQLVFMAVIGANSGKFVVVSIQKHGLSSIYVSVGAILFTLIIFVFIMRYFFKLNIIDVFGIFAGAMTSTPTLTMANEITKTDYPSISYASTYPFALIITMLLAQVAGVLL
jgi:putative transport protein